MAFNDCLACEITNAGKRAARMHGMGMSLVDIALHLSDVFAEHYWCTDNRLYRASKQYPFTPILILEIENKVLTQ